MKNQHRIEINIEKLIEYNPDRNVLLRLRDELNEYKFLFETSSDEIPMEKISINSDMCEMLFNILKKELKLKYPDMTKFGIELYAPQLWLDNAITEDDSLSHNIMILKNT